VFEKKVKSTIRQYSMMFIMVMSSLAFCVLVTPMWLTEALRASGYITKVT
jgi:hypothetical protein